MNASAYPNSRNTVGANGNDGYTAGTPGSTSTTGHTTVTGSAAVDTTYGVHAQGSNESVGTLLRQLTRDVPDLLVKELALARAEITESMRDMKEGIASMVTGGAVLLSGLIILLMSAVYGLSNVMEPWLAALIVGGVVLLIGLAMVSAGKKKLEPSSLAPDRTMHQMSKDKAAITGRTA